MKTYLIPLMVAASMLVGCNRSIESASQDYNSLPPAVQKAIRAEAPDAEIASISKRTENGMDAYQVDLRSQGQSSTMLVSVDGRVLRTDLPSKPAGKLEKALTPTGAVGTQFSALPEKVQKTIESRAPQSEIANISRHEDNGLVTYEVEFKDVGKNPTMRIAEDGTLLQDLQK